MTKSSGAARRSEEAIEVNALLLLRRSHPAWLITAGEIEISELKPKNLIAEAERSGEIDQHFQLVQTSLRRLTPDP